MYGFFMVLLAAQVMKVIVTVVIDCRIVGNDCCCGERGSQLGVRFGVCGPCVLCYIVLALHLEH